MLNFYIRKYCFAFFKIIQGTHSALTIKKTKNLDRFNQAFFLLITTWLVLIISKISLMHLEKIKKDILDCIFLKEFAFFILNISCAEYTKVNQRQFNLLLVEWFGLVWHNDIDIHHTSLTFRGDGRGPLIWQAKKLRWH